LSDAIGKSTGIKFPPTASLSCFHADCDGHAASEGRRRLKFVLASRRRDKIGSSAADPIAFKNALRFIYNYCHRIFRRRSMARLGESSARVYKQKGAKQLLAR
jgi:hypothetical protein